MSWRTRSIKDVLLLRGSVWFDIGYIMIELISKEPKPRGHTRSTYIRQGPLEPKPRSGSTGAAIA